MALTKRKETNMIVMHHSGVATYQQTMESLLNFCRHQYENGIGYHFIIDTDGSVTRGRDIECVGAHAKGYNSISIGICLRGNFEVEKPTTAQTVAMVDLIKDIRKRFPNTKITYHKDLNATACPGKNFPYSITDRMNEVQQLSVYEFQYNAVLDGFSFPKYGIDGKFGIETETVMKKAIVKKWSKYKNLVKLIQIKVGVNVDGIFGNKTLEGVKKYQYNNYLTVDGIVGVNTWKKITGVK